jgi:hypothetical protein
VEGEEMAIKTRKLGANDTKYEDLVHYICARCEDPSMLGATKLNKVLYFSDFLSFLNYGSSITGETYVKQQFGPVPKRILAILEKLRKANRIVQRESDLAGYTQRQFISLVPAKTGSFSAQEIALVDRVLDIVSHKHTASSISELSHDDIWKRAEIGEEIPYETILVSRLGDIDEKDVKWANAAIKKALAKDAA